VFFAAVRKSPRMVVAADVLAFVTVQYAGGSARRLQVGGEGVGVDGAAAGVERVRAVRVPAAHGDCRDRLPERSGVASIRRPSPHITKMYLPHNAE
jgi:hypothetical protein